MLTIFDKGGFVIWLTDQLLEIIKFIYFFLKKYWLYLLIKATRLVNPDLPLPIDPFSLEHRTNDISARRLQRSPPLQIQPHKLELTQFQMSSEEISQLYADPTGGHSISHSPEKNDDEHYNSQDGIVTASKNRSHIQRVPDSGMYRLDRMFSDFHFCPLSYAIGWKGRSTCLMVG